MMTAELRPGALVEIDIGEKCPPLLSTTPRCPRGALFLRHQLSGRWPGVSRAPVTSGTPQPPCRIVGCEETHPVGETSGRVNRNCHGGRTVPVVKHRLSCHDWYRPLAEALAGVEIAVVAIEVA